MTRSKTPKLDALIAQEPDLVDRIFEYLLTEFPQLRGQNFDKAKKAVRDEFGGQEAYIPQRPPSERQELAQSVLQLFNGRNATEVARRLHISRATVYRLLKQEGSEKKASQLSGK
ncbi:MAG TPA: Mor transcription activator family protein [Solimonas sp.]